jgi:hypothetical protein
MHRKNNETVLACVPFMLMFSTVPYKDYIYGTRRSFLCDVTCVAAFL